MEKTKSQELVQKLREIKERNEITFPRIMDLMEESGKVVSLSTLRRVFANGSDANSFSYENTLLPIANVLLNIENAPDILNSPRAKEIEGLKAVIRCQNEELSQLYATKEYLESQVSMLMNQITLKDKRMDAKDDMIRRLMEKHDII